MKKTTAFAVILTSAVLLCFAEFFSFASVQSLMAAKPERPVQIETRPIWEITQDGTATSVTWANADNPRFAIYDPGTPEDETDDAVLDKETGLVWERTPDTTLRVWFTAITHCYQSELANRKGLRLPTVEELASLVDEGEGPPTLPAGHPFINVQSALYWSSTTIANVTTGAWHVNFSIGNVGPSALDNAFCVWCVRGGQGHLQ